ncbi:hypothetical protein BH23GEM9_BH23GEM9_25490 [soil metagenome]
MEWGTTMKQDTSRPRAIHVLRAATVAGCVCAATAAPLNAQRLIERTPNLPNSVTALPGMLEASLTNRFSHAPGVSGVAGAATFDLALGLPYLLPLRWTGGLRFAPASGIAAADEWELYDRVGVLRQAAGAPLDLTVTGAYNITARRLDAEATLARRLGPLRLIGVGRAVSSHEADASTRLVIGGGGVWHVRPRRSPLTLAADFATLTDRSAGEEPAWSAAVQTGLPHTTLSLSLHATNVTSTTLRGASAGGRRTRWGVELNAPVEFVGFLTGWYASRERTRRAVQGDIDVTAATTVRMYGYLYSPATLRVRAGDVVEWINEDDVVHTVTAEHGGFDSGGIQPGRSWRARFIEAGIYAYYCGPHPFMKGVVVVQ